MLQPIFSKHFRIKTYKTPILRELIIYSRRNSRPNPKHIDRLASVLKQIPLSEQNSYKHIPHMSNDLADYISTSMAYTPSPKRKCQSKPVRIKRNQNFCQSRSRESLSPETRNIAYCLSKHKMEEESIFQPTMVKDPEFSKDDHHKQICNCKITEIDFKKMVSVQIGEYKLFVSCKFAASDLTELIEKKIMAILSVGELPKCYPMIKGGYFHLDFSGVAIFKALQQATRFLNAKLRTGNVLVHCEDGNKKSVILVIAYLLKETRLTFRAISELLKSCRPFYSLNPDEELYLRKFDKN